MQFESFPNQRPDERSNQHESKLAGEYGDWLHQAQPIYGQYKFGGPAHQQPQTNLARPGDPPSGSNIPPTIGELANPGSPVPVKPPEGSSVADSQSERPRPHLPKGFCQSSTAAATNQVLLGGSLGLVFGTLAAAALPERYGIVRNGISALGAALGIGHGMDYNAAEELSCIKKNYPEFR